MLVLKRRLKRIHNSERQLSLRFWIRLAEALSDLAGFKGLWPLRSELSSPRSFSQPLPRTADFDRAIQRAFLLMPLRVVRVLDASILSRHLQPTIA